MTLTVDWDKMNGLVPAVIQDAGGGAVLMLGYMNREALTATEATRRVTFWSRSKGRLWTKGESSGHYLQVVEIAVDCDGDSLLILAHPTGPVCHLGTPTCWSDAPRSRAERHAFLGELEATIAERVATRPPGSYTTRLLDQGLTRVAQKVGEEGVELALAAVTQSGAEILGEAADLVYHMLVLLQAKGLSLADVAETLRARSASAPSGT
jgi:phosphoribosyl-ATP pyrophosphohydrolase/phosphoribosyl-AMP cyclohydrolase